MPVASTVLRRGGECRWFLGVALVVGIASIAALIGGMAVGVPVGEIHASYTLVVLKVGLLAIPLAAAPLALLALIRGVRSPFAELHKAIVSRAGSLDLAIGTLGPIVLMPVLLGAYGTLKQITPLIAPFAWDDTLAGVDLLLLGGFHPLEVTHFFLGSPGPTRTIGVIYGLWLPLLFFAVLGFSVFAPAYLRARFFVAFAASWLLVGVVAAYLLSSAGPCYAELVGATSGKRFAPMLSEMRALNVGMFGWQDELWEAYSEHRYGFGYGISAMPSMHNTIAFIYVLAAAGARLWVRLASWAFAAVILIGSVHLGWHYLVDGLVAWAAAAAIWWGAGRYLKWCGYVPGPARAIRHVDDAELPEPLPA